MSSFSLGRSVALCSRPLKASSVHSRITVPGVTRRTGSTPPKGQAASSRAGRDPKDRLAAAEGPGVLVSLWGEFDNVHRGSSRHGYPLIVTPVHQRHVP